MPVLDHPDHGVLRFAGFALLLSGAATGSTGSPGGGPTAPSTTAPTFDNTTGPGFDADTWSFDAG